MGEPFFTALHNVLEAGPRRDPVRRVELKLGGRSETLSVGGDAPVAHLIDRSSDAGRVTLLDDGGRTPVVARLETSYVPAADGSHVAASASGFVVTRELLRVLAEDVPLEHVALDQPGAIPLRVGDVVEDHVQVVNPVPHHFVAIVVPLAAGMEPLNPALATAPPEARPRNAATLQPTYVQVLDDSASFFYDDELPAGTYDLYFRTRAQAPGSYVQPAARAELMYDAAVRGNSAGARIQVAKAE